MKISLKEMYYQLQVRCTRRNKNNFVAADKIYSAFLAGLVPFLAGNGFCDRMMREARRRAAWVKSLRYLCFTIMDFSLCNDLRAPAFMVTLSLLAEGM